MASAGMMKESSNQHIRDQSIRLYHGVFALIPANALPLLPAPMLENAYRISEKPCGPSIISYLRWSLRADSSSCSPQTAQPN